MALTSQRFAMQQFACCRIMRQKQARTEQRDTRAQGRPYGSRILTLVAVLSEGRLLNPAPPQTPAGRQAVLR